MKTMTALACTVAVTAGAAFADGHAQNWDMPMAYSATNFHSENGVKFADAEPLMMKYGERLRITLVNDTMMNHPVHLHGMWSELESGDDQYLARKHTIVAQPGAKITYLVTADAKGQWAYHCHLIYHMEGMFRRVVVA